jgi:hypothetical protein
MIGRFWRWLQRWFWYLLGYYRNEFRLVPVIGPVREQSEPPAPAPQYIQWPVTRRNLLMAFSMTVTQKVDLSVTITDKFGNPAEVDGIPEWAVDNNVLVLTPAPDGMSCGAAASGAMGTATVTFTCDADLGAGVEPLIGTLDFDVTAGKAAVVTINPGTPSEQSRK